MIAKYGDAVTAELEAQEFVMKKWTTEELNDLYTHFRQKVLALDI